MMKKSLLVGLLLSSALIGTAYSQVLIGMALSVPALQLEGRNVDDTNNTEPQSAMTLDRSGMDKASVHLQILQQSTAHFVGSVVAKKPTSANKKLPIKSQSNS